MEIAILSLLKVRNCSLCAHFDGEGWCALPEDDKAISGYIPEPAKVVCTQWVKVDEEKPE